MVRRRLMRRSRKRSGSHSSCSKSPGRSIPTPVALPQLAPFDLFDEGSPECLEHAFSQAAAPWRVLRPVPERPPWEIQDHQPGARAVPMRRVNPLAGRTEDSPDQRFHLLAEQRIFFLRLLQSRLKSGDKFAQQSQFIFSCAGAGHALRYLRCSDIITYSN